MRQTRGDLWAAADDGSSWLVIPTNGTLARDGSLVMGAGVAGHAKRRWPALPRRLGAHVAEHGNTPAVVADHRCLTWPTKPDQHTLPDGSTHPGWMCGTRVSDPTCNRLIAHTTWVNGPLLVAAVNRHLPADAAVFLPKVGCGLGGLDWVKVRPWLQQLLDDRFTVVI